MAKSTKDSKAGGGDVAKANGARRRKMGPRKASEKKSPADRLFDALLDAIGIEAESGDLSPLEIQTVLCQMAVSWSAGFDGDYARARQRIVQTVRQAERIARQQIRRPEGAASASAETGAEHFALAMLMPDDQIRPAIRALDLSDERRIGDLARRFRVTPDMVLRRIAQLAAE